MASESQCRAITRAGARCSNSAKTAGFCAVHFPKSKSSSLLTTAKNVGQVVTTATGIITLIKTAVELWQSLPFGSGPTMPESYDLLVEKIGPSWVSAFSDTYSPGNHSGSSVDWSQALDIYEFAERQLEKDTKSAEQQEQTSAILSTLAEQFIDSLPYELKQRMYKQVGTSE